MESKYYTAKPYNTQPSLIDVKDESLDRFIGQRSKILNDKLEVLMSEIQSRLAIKSNNMQSVDNDMTVVKDLMQDLSPKAHYINDSTEKDEFHKLKRKSLDLEKEKRDQEISCWNDVVPVVRDLLNTWEAHEQSSARSQLLNSNGLEDIIDKSYSSTGGQQYSE